jgi:peptidylprolyl isomerase
MKRILTAASLLLLFTMGGAMGQTGTTSKITTNTKTTAKPSKAMTKEITTPSGLKYVDNVVGTGDSPVKGKQVTVNYTGKLMNGTVFDSNVDPKFGHTQPFQFLIGNGQVIKGWDEGVMSMKVGGKRTLTIPPGLAYGDKAVGGVIPANSTLIFDVELVKVAK